MVCHGFTVTICLWRRLESRGVCLNIPVQGSKCNIYISNNGNHSLPLILWLALMAKQFLYYCNCVSQHWHNELNVEVLCCLKRANQSPDFEQYWICQELNMINVGTQGHNCDSENKPIIGRMPDLSSEDSDTFWWHKPYLSFWLCLENYLVTMDPHFGKLFPSNFVPWLITHFAGSTIDINYSNLDSEKFPVPRAKQVNLKHQ